MTPPLRISELRFNGGTSVDTRQADIVLLVGPNNSGKSRTLQEIMSLASHTMGPSFDRSQLFAIEGYGIEKLVDVDGLTSWLTSHRTSSIDPSSRRQSVRAIGYGDFFLDETAQFWNQDEHFGRLAQQIFRFVGPGDGRGLLGSPGRLEPRQVPDHVIQTLIRNPNIRKDFEAAFRAAFHQNVIVDSWFTATRLRLSDTETQQNFAYTSSDGLPSEELADRLAALPLIETQSDGVRAFAGLLLTLIAVRHPVLLLDEPETFLHPPQARLLGEYLGKLRRDGQLIIATHSLDILLGLLQQTTARVLVVRLSRDGDMTNGLTMDPDLVRSLWRDPLLRFSRALDGIFHEGVVVCEGDTDSQFYSAISYHLASNHLGDEATPETEDDSHSFAANPFDLMFGAAGGKQRIPMLAAALHAVHVPVQCIADFDVLNDSGILKRIVESLGFEYSDEMDALRRQVDAGIRGHGAQLTLLLARQKVMEALEGPDDGPVTNSIVKKVENAIEPPAGWHAAKRIGSRAVPNGNATVALDRLVALLRDCGVNVVPSGAVESWVPSVGNHGTTWVAEVMERGLVAEATNAQAFVSRIVDDLVEPSSRPIA